MDSYENHEMVNGDADPLGFDWSQPEARSGKPKSKFTINFYYEGVVDATLSKEKGFTYKVPKVYILKSALNEHGQVMTDVRKPATAADFKAFPEEYRRFQESEKPVDGFDLKDWPAVTKVDLHNLNAAGIRSMEELIKTPDELLTKIKYSLVMLKEKAIAYFEYAKDSSVVIRQADEIQRLKFDLNHAKEQMAFMQMKLNEATGQKGEVVMPQSMTQAPSVDLRSLKEEILKELKLGDIQPKKIDKRSKEYRDSLKKESI